MVPVWTQTPPMVFVRSTMATFLRNFAAQIAPFCPAGPLPMTTRSYSLALIELSLWNGGFLRGFGGTTCASGGPRNRTYTRFSGHPRRRVPRPSLGQLNEEILRCKSFPVELSRQLVSACIASVAIQDTGFGGIRKIAQQDLFIDPPAQLRIVQREHHFDAFVKVARHPVGAAQVNLRFAGILEVVNPAVLKEPADDAAYPDAVAQPANSRAKGAAAAHDQVDLHSGLRSPVQRLDDSRIEESIDFSDDPGGPVPARIGGLSVDQIYATGRQISRGQK